MRKVYLGLPCYGDHIHIATMASVFACGVKDIKIEAKSNSLLCHCFNLLLANAINDHATHFVLLHSDCAPESGWLAKMLEIIESHQLAALSVVSPIKTHRGLTSTALDYADRGPRRLTLKEIHNKLPETFTVEDTQYAFPDGHERLLINTGCLLIDLQRFDHRPPAFKTQDAWCFSEKWLGAWTFPEDWGFSRELAGLGLRYAATRAVGLVHYGAAPFVNTEAWGEETDG